MRRPLRWLAPSSWLKLPYRTARTRLTVVYAGMFLVTGIILLAIVNVVVRHGSSIAVTPANVRSLGSGAFQIAPFSGAGPHGLVSAQQSLDNSRLLAVSLVVLAFATAVSALFGWIAAGRVLRPLQKMAATAQAISARNLHERLALAGPNDEFKRLGDTLDALLGRLEASFEAQRRFVANASHELRTPLTLERTLLQVTLADPNASVQTFRETCEELLATGRDQERLLEALLTLASSERGLDRREALDLARVVAHALAGARAEAEQLDIELDATLDPAVVSGDRALIERLVANLVENALRYNRAGGRVEVRTATDGDRVVLTVSNTGPKIEAWDVERLFEPFQRQGAERMVAAGNGDAGGHGLGLSIARAIAGAHDGEIGAEPRAEGGLVVRVSLPGRDA